MKKWFRYSVFLLWIVLLYGCGSHKGEEVKNREQEEVENIKKEENLKELIRTYITEELLTWGDSGEVFVSKVSEDLDQGDQKLVGIKVLLGDGTGLQGGLDLDNLQKKEKGEKYYGNIWWCEAYSALTVRQQQEKENLYNEYWKIEEEEWFHFSFYSHQLQEEWVDQIEKICKRVWEENNFLYNEDEYKEYTFKAWAVKASPLEIAITISENIAPNDNIYLFKYSLTQEQIVHVGYIGGEGQDKLWEMFTEEDAIYLGEGSFATEEGAEPEYETGPEAEKIREIWQWSVEEHLKKYGMGDYIRIEIGQYQDIYPRLWAKVYYEEGYFWVYSYGTRLGELTPGLVADDYQGEMITFIKE